MVSSKRIVMIKKIINWILSLLLLLSLTTVIVSYVLRNFVASDNIEKMIFTDNKIIIDNEENKFNEYIDEQEINKIYSKILSDYIKYNMGINKEEPSLEELRNILNKYCDNYDKDSEFKINRAFIDINIDKLDKNLKDNMIIKNKKYNKIFNLLYAKITLYSAIILFILIIVIIFLINRNILKLIADLISVFMMNTVGMFLMGIVIEYKLRNEIGIEAIIKYLKDILNNVALYSLIIGIILLVIYFIVLKIKKKN